MKLREFFIEDRLERFRNNSFCNLGESGFHSFSMRELFEILELDLLSLGEISLKDSPNQGNHILRELIANLYPGVTAEEVLVTTGSSEALFLFFSEFVSPGRKVSFYWPAFQALYEIPKSFGASLFPKSLLSQTELLASDWEGDSSDLWIVNHPHNPTGLTFSEEEWRAFIDLCNSRKIGYVLFDEHYRFLTKEAPLGLGNSGVDPQKNRIGTGSFIKCFGVPGLRIGWFIGPKSLVQILRSKKDYLTHTVSPLSENIAIQILQNQSKIHSLVYQKWLKNLQFFQENLNKIPFITDCKLPQGGLVGWLKLNSEQSEVFVDWLYEKTGVFLLPGKAFECEGYARIGFGERPDVFQEGIQRWISLGK